MDKILLTVFLSSLAGFITAVLSIVKLVNEKENKTTEYRQAWTESVRTSLALLISNLNTQASNIVNLHDGLDGVFDDNTPNDEKTDSSSKRINEILDHRIKEDIAAVRAMRREIHHSYAQTRLHFKPNDISFSRIEQKFDVIMAMIDGFKNIAGENKEGERLVQREKIFSAVGDLTDYSRDILKTEWESVKKGEPAYQTTKQWSFIGGIIMLTIILIIGIHSFFTINRSTTQSTNNSATTAISESTSSNQTKSIPIDPSNPTIAPHIINSIQCEISPIKSPSPASIKSNNMDHCKK